MGKVHVLDPVLANQIAAGEVVERPASAAKELIENALDASATAVTVDLESGGLKRLRVVDNGCGMTPEDAREALNRHATSKVAQVEDLSDIGTLGFRGEALPSIASVSRFSIKTRTPDSVGAFEICVEGGTVVSAKEVAGPVGTTVMVEDLFFNVPARRKFLKAAATEGSHITETIERLALGYPEVSFRLLKDGKVTLDLPRHSNLMARAHALFGSKEAEPLRELNAKDGIFSLDGLFAPASVSFATNRRVYLFVNGRFVRDKVLLSAIQQAYRTGIERGRSPFVVLRLKMPGQLVDVNVHPAKTEVRFADTQAIHQFLLHSLDDALMRASSLSESAQTPSNRGNWAYDLTPAAPVEKSDPLPPAPKPVTVAPREPKQASVPVSKAFEANRPAQNSQEPTLFWGNWAPQNSFPQNQKSSSGLSAHRQRIQNAMSNAGHSSFSAEERTVSFDFGAKKSTAPAEMPVEDAVQAESALANPYESADPKRSALANPYESADPKRSALANPYDSGDPKRSALANPYDDGDPKRSALANPYDDGDPKRSALANPYDDAVQTGSDSAQLSDEAQISEKVPILDLGGMISFVHGDDLVVVDRAKAWEHLIAHDLDACACEKVEAGSLNLGVSTTTKLEAARIVCSAIDLMWSAVGPGVISIDECPACLKDSIETGLKLLAALPRAERSKKEVIVSKLAMISAAGINAARDHELMKRLQNEVSFEDAAFAFCLSKAELARKTNRRSR